MWQVTVFDNFETNYSYIILNDKHISVATKSEDFLLAQQIMKLLKHNVVA